MMYESKALVRQDFQGFRQMFLLLGGALCAIVGVVGILNFFNAILTGILVRKREFAMLQAVGMTGRQLKKMLVQRDFSMREPPSFYPLCWCSFWNRWSGACWKTCSGSLLIILM